VAARLGVPRAIPMIVIFWSYDRRMKSLYQLLSEFFMDHYFPTRPVDDQSINTDQICEMKEELLCPFPGCSAHAIASGHLVTFVYITQIMWHDLSVVINCTTTIYFPHVEVIK
jgi:hypothetical protein